MRAAHNIDAHSLPGIAYIPRAEAGPESERPALTAIYRFIIDTHAKKKGTTQPGSPDDAKGLNMIAPKSVYTSDPPDPLSDFRALIDRRPEAFYWDARKLASFLDCSESEIEGAWRWMLEDGLELRV